MILLSADDPITAPVNGALIAISVILSMVVASIGEAEYGGVFINGQIGADIRQKLIGMGYPQPPTVIITDNHCAAGLANKSIKQLKTKSIDMRFHWIRDRIVQHQFKVIWQKGIDNVADYFTKIHPTSHHRQRRHLYVHTELIGRIASSKSESQQQASGVCYSQTKPIGYSPYITRD